MELEEIGTPRGVETQDGLVSWSTFDDQLNPKSGLKHVAQGHGCLDFESVNG